MMLQYDGEPGSCCTAREGAAGGGAGSGGSHVWRRRQHGSSLWRVLWCKPRDRIDPHLPPSLPCYLCASAAGRGGWMPPSDRGAVLTTAPQPFPGKPGRRSPTAPIFIGLGVLLVILALLCLYSYRRSRRTAAEQGEHGACCRPRPPPCHQVCTHWPPFPHPPAAGPHLRRSLWNMCTVPGAVTLTQVPPDVLRVQRCARRSKRWPSPTRPRQSWNLQCRSG